ncbi:MAG: hypothetical protein GY861_01605, partial [bacterium]|nr:hypothetical protein [bacterium]
DDKFTFKCYKRGYASGIYTCEVSTTKTFESEQEITILIKEIGAKDFTELKEQAIPLLIQPKLPPDTDKTVFLNVPGKTHPAGKLMTIKFQITDQYGNHIINNPQLTSNIKLTNHGNVVDSETKLNDDGKTYELTSSLVYPVRECNLQIIFTDDGNNCELNNAAWRTTLVSDSSYENSKVRGSNLTKAVAGEKTEAMIRLYDQNKVCVDSNKDIEVYAEVSGPTGDSKPIKYRFNFRLRKNPALKECITFYEMEIPDDKVLTKAGDYQWVYNVGGKKVKDIKQQVINAPFDDSSFAIYNFSTKVNYNQLPAGTKFVHHIKAFDKYNNQSLDALSATLKPKIASRSPDVKLKDEDWTCVSKEETSGILTVTCNINKMGEFYMALEWNKKELGDINRKNGPSIYKVVPLQCAGAYTEYNCSNIKNAVVDTETNLSFACFDKFQNRLPTGGSKIVLSIKVDDETCPHTLRDNADGSYTIKFTPTVAGMYQIQIKVDNDEAYGDEAREFEIKNPVCEGKTPVRCYNKPSKCVAQIQNCVGKTNCPPEKPFFLFVNKERVCVESQTEADCPKGYTKAKSQPFCDKSENLAQSDPNTLSVKCKKGEYNCSDGVCRKNKNQCPNRHGCPVGFFLCSNLTCQAKYEACPSYPKCATNQVRCGDQSCAANFNSCPNLITCTNADDVVGPDRSCEERELDIKPIKACPEENPVQCYDGTCVNEAKDCLKGKVCGANKALSESGACLEIINKNEVEEEELTTEEIVRRIQPSYEAEERVKEAERLAEEERKKKEAEERKRKEEEEKQRKEEEARKKKEEEERKKREEEI